MNGYPCENSEIPTTPRLNKPTSVPGALDVALAAEQLPRDTGVSGTENHGVEEVFRPSAAHLARLVPARKHTGPRIQKHLPLSIPEISPTPSSASNYTPSTPRNSYTPLLLSAMLPSPITPSVAEPTQNLTNTSSNSDISTSETTLADSFLSPDISLTSLWSFDSSPSPTHPNGEPWMSLADPNFSLRQKPLRSAKMSDSQRIEQAMKAIEDLHYSSVAEFFSSYIQQIPPGSSEKFSERHRRSLKSFLQGETRIKPINIVEQLYHHCYSYPSNKSNRQEERELFFHPYSPPESIKYARISISAWATQLVGSQVEKSIKALTREPCIPDSFSAQVPVCLAATANDRTKAKGVQTVSKEDLLLFRFANRAKLFEERAPLVWYLTACMATPKKHGIVVARKRRNPSLGF